ncbi:MAG: hypothetical protein ACYS8W_19600, partial [Planctomycetota bacterium]
SEVHERKLIKLQHEPREKWAKRIIDKHGEVERRTKVQSMQEREDWSKYKKLLERLYKMIDKIVESLPFLEVSRSSVKVPFGYFDADGPDHNEAMTCLTIMDRGRRAVHLVPRGINYIGSGGKLAVRQVHPRRIVNFEKGGVFTAEGGRWVYFEHNPKGHREVAFEEADIRRLIERTFVG